MRFPRKGLAPRGLRRAVPVPASAGQGSSWPSVSPDHSLVGGRTFPARSPGSGQARHPDEADNRRPRRVKSAPMIGQSLDRSGGCWAPLRKSDQGISAEMAGSSSSGKRHLGAWRLAKSRRRPSVCCACSSRILRRQRDARSSVGLESQGTVRREAATHSRKTSARTVVVTNTE